jgi:hypothetical protein
MKAAFIPFLQHLMKPPQTLEESTEFLSIPFCNALQVQFDASVNILIQNLHLISYPQFFQLSNDALFSLFTSTQFKIIHEDSLFQLIIALINENTTRKGLLRAVHFAYISSQLMIDFFRDFPLQDVDDNLFEALKDRLFSDIAKPNSQIPFERFTESPKFLSREEMNQLFSILQTCLKTDENPIHQLQNIIQENEELKKENQQHRIQLEK